MAWPSNTLATRQNITRQQMRHHYVSYLVHFTSQFTMFTFHHFALARIHRLRKRWSIAWGLRAPSNQGGLNKGTSSRPAFEIPGDVITMIGAIVAEFSTTTHSD